MGNSKPVLSMHESMLRGNESDHANTQTNLWFCHHTMHAVVKCMVKCASFSDRCSSNMQAMTVQAFKVHTWHPEQHAGDAFARIELTIHKILNSLCTHVPKTLFSPMMVLPVHATCCCATCSWMRARRYRAIPFVFVYNNIGNILQFKMRFEVSFCFKQIICVTASDVCLYCLKRQHFRYTIIVHASTEVITCS